MYVAYFSLDENSPIAVELTKQGKILAVSENGYITIKKGDWKIRIEKIINVPLTLQGKAKFMIQNVLAATLAGYLCEFKIEDISLALQTFVPSPTQTPGRINIFEFKKFTIMIDFAHNPTVYLAIEDFLSFIESPRKIGIIAGVGDRRDEDIIACGRIAARMFNHIIIRQEKNLGGRTEKEIIELLLKGILSTNNQTTYEIISNESEAIKHVLAIAKEGDYIIALSDMVSDAITLVQSHYEKEKNTNNLTIS